MPSEPSALPLRQDQTRAAAVLMVRAFLDDPFFTYAFPQVSRRQSRMPWLFERNTRYGLRYGRIFTTPHLEGVAIWLGPDNPQIKLPGALRSGLFLFPFMLRPSELSRILRMENATNRLHRRCVRGRHWYLLELGVDPASQGRGVGGRLLQPVLKLADRENIPCYLETNNERNLSFYERYGFSLAGSIRASPAAPYIWGMRREPKK